MGYETPQTNASQRNHSYKVEKRGESALRHPAGGTELSLDHVSSGSQVGICTIRPVSLTVKLREIKE